METCEDPCQGAAIHFEVTVLGMSLDLLHLVQGCVVLENKEARIDGISSKVRKLEAKGEVHRHEAQVLMVLLDYASFLVTA